MNEENVPNQSNYQSFRIFADDGVAIPAGPQAQEAAMVIQRSFRQRTVGTDGPYTYAYAEATENDVETGVASRERMNRQFASSGSNISEIFVDDMSLEPSSSSYENLEDLKAKKGTGDENEDKKAIKSILGGFGAMGVAGAIGVAFGMFMSGPIVDEEDVLAAVTLAKASEGTGTAVAGAAAGSAGGVAEGGAAAGVAGGAAHGGAAAGAAGGAVEGAAAAGAAQGVSTAQAAVMQQMAVTAANNAAGSVAAGSQTLTNVAVGGAAGAGAGNSTSAAASSSSSTTTTAAGAATAVTAAAVATGVVVANQSGSLPPICPNVTNSSLYHGSVAMDFFWDRSYLNRSEVSTLSTLFEEVYNDTLGCQSAFAQVALNCTVPCEDILDNNNITIGSQCCEPYDAGLFGDIMRCEISCSVHCDGCFEFEPLFFGDGRLVDADILNVSEPAFIKIDGAIGSVESSGSCSVPCQIIQTVGSKFCSEVAFNESSKDEECLVLGFEALDTRTGEPLLDESFLEAPSATPSQVPSAAPSQVPSALPSLTPSEPPTLSPTLAPTIAPTPLPPLSFFLINADTNRRIGRLKNEGIISLSRYGTSRLSIEAFPKDGSQSVVFILDGVTFRPESMSPFALGGNKPKWDFFPVPELAVLGTHELIVTTYSETHGLGTPGLTETIVFEVVP